MRLWRRLIQPIVSWPARSTWPTAIGRYRRAHTTIERLFNRPCPRRCPSTRSSSTRCGISSAPKKRTGCIGRTTGSAIIRGCPGIRRTTRARTTHNRLHLDEFGAAVPVRRRPDPAQHRRPDQRTTGRRWLGLRIAVAAGRGQRPPRGLLTPGHILADLSYRLAAPRLARSAPYASDNTCVTLDHRRFQTRLTAQHWWRLYCTDQV